MQTRQHHDQHVHARDGLFACQFCAENHANVPRQGVLHDTAKSRPIPADGFHAAQNPPHSLGLTAGLRTVTIPSSRHRIYGGDVVTFLGVSQDNVAASRDFAHDFGITFPVLIDTGYPASNAYGLTTVPTFFLVNQDAMVQVASVGFGKAEIESIANALADRRNITRAPVFRSDESIPAHKPG